MMFCVKVAELAISKSIFSYDIGSATDLNMEYESADMFL